MIHRLCNVAGCDHSTPVNPTDTDAAFDTITDHYQDSHGMDPSQAGYFGAWHSTTKESAR
ncbi:hypothetical protein ABZ694_24990 [Streptomyces albidoflavus]|uniref:hypothetical protein n=1 Tax=Streptomyces albidoflavus TaxID=1886 RepID=UPI0033E8F2F2